jgi:hypothetical protein
MACLHCLYDFDHCPVDDWRVILLWFSIIQECASEISIVKSIVLVANQEVGTRLHLAALLYSVLKVILHHRF